MSRLWPWLQKIGNRRLTLRVLMALSILALVCMLAPLVLIAFDAHPVHDDFPHTLTVAEAWLRTGSLWEVFKAAWARTALMYETWQGTFAAMFLSALQPMVFSPKLFFLTPLLTLAGLCLSAAYASKSLIQRTLHAGPPVFWVFYAALMAMLLQFLPSARELLYWHSGTPYTVSFTMLFLMLGLLLRFQEKSTKVHSLLRMLSLFGCGMVLGGCPYPLGLASAVGFGLLAMGCFRKRSPARWASIAAFAGTAIALGLVIMAPGNFVRQEAVGLQMSAVGAIIQSISECLEMTAKWFTPQWIAVALLLVPLLARPLKESPYGFEHPCLFLFFSFGVLAAAFVPPIYATGVEGYRVERVLSSLYMLYVVIVFLNLLYWTGYAARRWERPFSVMEAYEKKGILASYCLLCCALFVWGLFSVAIMATPSISAAKSLLTGEADAYHQEMTLRENRIADSETPLDAVNAIQRFSVEPVVLPRDMLPYQKESGMPKMMYRYFHMHKLAEKYGVGQIPQAEWEALDAWAKK